MDPMVTAFIFIIGVAAVFATILGIFAYLGVAYLDSEAKKKFDGVHTWLARREKIAEDLSAMTAATEHDPGLRDSDDLVAMYNLLDESERGLAAAVDTYNRAIQEYNDEIRRFPSNIIAQLLGFREKLLFDAEKHAGKDPPEHRDA